MTRVPGASGRGYARSMDADRAGARGEDVEGMVAKPSGTGRSGADPAVQASGQASAPPSRQPSGQPAKQPAGQPAKQPSAQPSGRPSAQPAGHPPAQPSGQSSGPP